MPECINPQVRELIHDYEMNQLTEAERDRFEEHLIDCPFCLHEAQAMQRLSTAMTANREAVLDALREDGLTFDRIRRRLTVRRESRWEMLAGWFQSWPGRSALAGAMAAAVLIGFLLRPQLANSPYFKDLSFQVPPYHSVQLRGGTLGEADKLFESAMEFYVQGKYAVAIGGIKHSLKLDSSHPDRWLYLGASQYALLDPKGAIKSLKEAERTGQGLTKTRARWYLSQSYLLQGKVDRARTLLESVAAENGERADDAKLLLVRIADRERQR
jgi:Putative zinc-finger